MTTLDYLMLAGYLLTCATLPFLLVMLGYEGWELVKELRKK